MTDKRDIHPLDELPAWLRYTVTAIGIILLICSGIGILFIIIAFAAANDKRKI